MNSGNVDIQRMAKKEGVLIALIKEFLGILPECPAATLEQAQEKCLKAFPGSREQKAALKEWREFSNQEIAAATTLDQTKKALERAPPGSKEERAANLKIISFYVVRP